MQGLGLQPRARRGDPLLTSKPSTLEGTGKLKLKGVGFLRGSRNPKPMGLGFHTRNPQPLGLGFHTRNPTLLGCRAWVCSFEPVEAIAFQTLNPQPLRGYIYIYMYTDIHSYTGTYIINIYILASDDPGAQKNKGGSRGEKAFP